MARPTTFRGRLAGGLLLLAALALLAAACGTGPTASGAPAPAPAAKGAAAGGGAVSIQDFAFQPAALKVTAGTRVTWTNGDGTAHTVTADGNGFGSGALDQGASFSFTFSRPGTYAYHCSIHPSMHGSVVVG